MSIHPLGPNGIQTRIEDLRSKFSSIHETENTTSFQIPTSSGHEEAVSIPDFLQPIAGEIKQSTIAPLNPFKFGMQPQTKDASHSFRPLIHQAALNAKLDPLLFEAIVQTESDFNPKLISRAGAMGLSQLMPENVKELGITDPFDPAQNLNGGAKHFAQMLGKFKDIRLALAAYNAGPGAVKKYQGIPPYKETQNYVKKVTSRFQALKQKLI